jgi:hypothetical protein
VLEGLPVVPAAGDHRAEHRRERVPGHAQPVGPGPVLARLVNVCIPCRSDGTSGCPANEVVMGD